LPICQQKFFIVIFTLTLDFVDKTWYTYGNKINMEIKMKRDKIIRIRVSKEEDKKLTESAEKVGLTKSAYLRTKGLQDDNAKS